MATANFKGFKQSLLSTFNGLSDDEKKGYLWLVRDLDSTGNTLSASVYFGTRKYAELNDSSASKEELEKLTESLKNSFGGLLDENGDFVGFPFNGSATEEENPILAEDADNVLDILKNLEAAILDRVAIDELYSAVTDITYTKAEIDEKVAGLWHFKGTKESFEELPTDASNGDVYQVGEIEYAWNGTEWVELGSKTDLTAYATKKEVNEQLSAITDDYNTLSGKVEEIAEKATTSAETYNDALDEAKAGDEGKIIYVTKATYVYKDESGNTITTTDKAEAEAADTGYTTYSEGAYIVTGEGTVSKVGTTTASGDLNDAVANLETKVEKLSGDTSDLKETLKTAGILDEDGTVLDVKNTIINDEKTTAASLNDLNNRVTTLESDSTHSISGDDIEE